MKVLRWPLYTPTKGEIKSLKDAYVTSSHEKGSKTAEHGKVIYCYSRYAFAHGFDDTEGVWNEVMRNTRGIVFDHNGECVARGLPKIFNLGENVLAQPPEDYKQIYLFEKFNGFCCHIWYDKESQQWRFTTKAGSQHEFEEYGNELAENNKMYGFPAMLDQDTVYIAEGVHEGDPHTIHYEPGLYLIGAIKDGVMEINMSAYPGEAFQVNSIAAAQELQEKVQHEGYVAYFTKGDEVLGALKLKSPFYIEKRKRRIMSEKLQKNAQLYSQFIVQDGSVVYSHEYAKETLGEFYDDWWTMAKDVIDEATLNLNALYINAMSYLATTKGLTRKRVYLGAKDRGMNTSLVMAIYDEKPNPVLGRLGANMVEAMV